MRRPISVSLRPEIIAALDRQAEAEDRSRSWLADRAIDEWLATHAKAAPCNAIAPLQREIAA
jgi:predicted transcriptional regulator